MTHIDDWIEKKIYGNCTDKEQYALAFFFLKGMDAVSSGVIKPIMKDHKLFCDYQNKRYRVTGYSIMGDIWLHTNFETDHGYTDKVNIAFCSNWSPNEIKD